MQHDKEIERAYLCFEGPFNIQIISSFAKFLSELTIASHSERKKLYRVFIELTQNVALYSIDRTPLSNNTTIGKGKVYILDEAEEFKCITMNKILKEHAPVLLNNCNEINATPVNILKIKKRELYRLSSFQDTGAHIGLIMIYLFSEHALDFEVIEVSDNEIYFKIIATIKKNELTENDEIR
jgi:hypothetical protein